MHVKYSNFWGRSIEIGLGNAGGYLENQLLDMDLLGTITGTTIWCAFVASALAGFSTWLLIWGSFAGVLDHLSALVIQTL